MMQKTIPCFAFLLVLAIFSGVATAADEYEISGISIHTKLNQGTIEDAVYAAFASLPSENTLVIPYYFSGDPGTTTLQADFDGANLDVLAGYPLEPDSVGLLIVDISSVQSQTGELFLTLSSTGDTEAELILIKSLAVVAASANGGESGSGSGGGGGGSFDLLLLLLIFMVTITKAHWLKRQMCLE